MTHYDLIVLGAGPGGYTAALRAASFGFKTACIDRENRLGGTCLRVGCIPSKVLLEATERFTTEIPGAERPRSIDLQKLMEHKEKIVSRLSSGISSLFQKQNVAFYQGEAKLSDAHQIRIDSLDLNITADRVLIATGSEPNRLPCIDFEDERIGDSTAALSYSEIPKHLAIIGGGNIGLELGQIWHRLGSKVTVIEFQNRILPGTDEEIAREALRIYKRQGMTILTQNAVTSVSANDQITLNLSNHDPISADRVLVSTGRHPNLRNLGLEQIGLESDRPLRVDRRFETKVKGVYAIGDVIPGPMLAHRAEAEARSAIDQMNGLPGNLPEYIPAITYTAPEIATVGATEEALRLAQIPYLKGIAFFRANGRANAIDRIEGKIKLLADAENHQILGVHIIGPHAGDLIAEATLAISLKATPEDIARTCHAHPTLSEALRDAAQNAIESQKA